MSSYLELSVGSSGKNILGERVAQVFTVKILPTQWMENLLLLQIRRGENEHQTGVLS